MTHLEPSSLLLLPKEARRARRPKSVALALECATVGIVAFVLVTWRSMPYGLSRSIASERPRERSHQSIASTALPTTTLSSLPLIQI